MNIALFLQQGTAQTIAAVFYILLIIFEAYVGYKKKTRVYDKNDTFVNLCLGVLTSFTKLFTKGMTLAVFQYIHTHFVLFEFDSYTILMVVTLVFLNDLVFYWYHRLGHESRLFWALHVAHHSSEVFNLSTAIRGNFIHFWYRFLFWSPLVIIGFDPLLVVLIDEIGFYYQMWIHTEAIQKMPRWFAAIFNTPSHHRVHHGSNEIYLDKNYAAVFIIWDRLFKTFQKEEEKVRYGITTPLQKQNVLHVITHELRDIWDDAIHANSFKEALFYIFANPGKVAHYKVNKHPEKYAVS